MLERSAIKTKSGERRTDRACKDDVECRLIDREDRHSRGRYADERKALERMDLCARVDRREEPGDDVHLDPEVLVSAQKLERLLDRTLEKRDDDALDVDARDDLRKLLGRSHNGDTLDGVGSAQLPDR